MFSFSGHLAEVGHRLVHTPGADHVGALRCCMTILYTAGEDDIVAVSANPPILIVRRPPTFRVQGLQDQSPRLRPGSKIAI